MSIEIVERDRPAGAIRSALAAGAVLLSVAIVDALLGDNASDNNPLDPSAVEALRRWVERRGLRHEVSRAAHRVMSILADSLWSPPADHERRN